MYKIQFICLEQQIGPFSTQLSLEIDMRISIDSQGSDGPWLLLRFKIIERNTCNVVCDVYIVSTATWEITCPMLYQ